MRERKPQIFHHQRKSRISGVPGSMKGVPGYMKKGVSVDNIRNIDNSKVSTLDDSKNRRPMSMFPMSILRMSMFRMLSTDTPPFSYSPELLSSSLELRKFLFIVDDGIFGFHGVPKNDLILMRKHTHTHTHLHTHTHKGLTPLTPECCWFSSCCPLAFYTDAS